LPLTHHIDGEALVLEKVIKVVDVSQNSHQGLIGEEAGSLGMRRVVVLDVLNDLRMFLLV
jgi:hypothetical protein